jgi:hypothetical protein
VRQQSTANGLEILPDLVEIQYCTVSTILLESDFEAADSMYYVPKIVILKIFNTLFLVR